MKKRNMILLLFMLMAMVLAGCSGNDAASGNSAATSSGTKTDPENVSESASAGLSEDAGPAAEGSADKTGSSGAARQDKDSISADDKAAAVEKNGEIYILYTSDVHCGIDSNFGYAGLYEYRQRLEEQGCTTILVDDGDFVQGGVLGTITKGEAIIRLMNEMDYDAVVPGNHEFDYGIEQLMHLVDMAEYPFICCNFTKDGKTVFKPYEIVEAAGKKIAFVGVTTPETLIKCTPSTFQDDKGNFIYSFMQNGDGSELYNAVQKAVDDARSEGADYVYVMAHLGNSAASAPYNYADVISHTDGIDVLLDGHSHDTDQVVMKNKDGKDVVRSAVGTRMNSIGYSHITDDGIVETDILSWPNKMSLQSMVKIDDPVSRAIEEEEAEVSTVLKEKVAKSSVELTIFDPAAKDNAGKPVRMVRRAETNLGDFVTDALRAMTDSEIGMINGGAIRDDLKKGDVTYEDMIAVFPFGDRIMVVEATGQEILDALEWGAKNAPEESGGFLQVSGLTYEIDTTVDSTCTSDENGMMTGVSGKRRVKNVMVNGEPLDPDRKYKTASVEFLILGHGDGNTAFDGAEVLVKDAGLDNQALIGFIADRLSGSIGEDYADPYGNGRIVIKE